MCPVEFMSFQRLVLGVWLTSKKDTAAFKESCLQKRILIERVITAVSVVKRLSSHIHVWSSYLKHTALCMKYFTINGVSTKP